MMLTVTCHELDLRGKEEPETAAVTGSHVTYDGQ